MVINVTQTKRTFITRMVINVTKTKKNIYNADGYKRDKNKKEHL